MFEYFVLEWVGHFKCSSCHLRWIDIHAEMLAMHANLELGRAFDVPEMNARGQIKVYTGYALGETVRI
jgi:hypothetical protein